MKVYENEKKDGLEAIISSNASLAYLTKLEIGSDDKADLAKLYETLAVKKDMNNYGLYPMKSILVSSVWNLNDDVFTGEELLAAKDTPRNKPLNIGHDQKEIVGHMTDCHVIDDEGKTVDVTLAEKDLPKKIHILADSFIYTHWYEDEQKAKVDELLEDIKAGKYCVSMECVFSDFDYALKDAKGTITIVKRDEGTSWMTKHLAVYKGSGSLIGQQIGRVPRNVSFNGIGIVKEPGNPDSIIFAKKEEFINPIENVGYLSSSELNTENSMKEEEFLAAKAELEKKVKELSETVSEKDAAFKALETSEATVKAEGLVLEARVKELTEVKETLEKSLSEATVKLELIEKEKVTATRIALASSKLSLSEDEAKSFVETLATLTEDNFTKFVEVQAAKFVKAPIVESKAELIEKVLESAEPTKEVSVAAATSVEEIDVNVKAREDMAKFLTKKKNNK